MLCEKCQLITSEFVLSRDFRNFGGLSVARANATPWSCRRDEQGKRYRILMHHDLQGLEAAVKQGCKVCAFFRKLLNRFSVNGFLPILNGPMKVSLSETGSFELIPPSEPGWGDLNLAWEEVLPAVSAGAFVRLEGYMRPIAGE